MKIDRNNYESYFLDYFENRLSSENVKVLRIFLSLNPDLLTEFNKFENITLETANLVYDEKYKLKKTHADINVINDRNLDDFCILKIEGDIAESADNKLMLYLEENPGKKAIYDLYLKLKLKPDYSIRFDGKSKLKRKYLGKYLLQTRYYVAVAAAIFFAIVYYAFLFNPETSVNQNLSTIKTVSAQKPHIAESKIPEKHLKTFQKNNYNRINEKSKEILLSENHRSNISLGLFAPKSAIVQSHIINDDASLLISGKKDLLANSVTEKLDSGKGNDGGFLSIQDYAVHKIVDLAQKGNIVNSDNKNISFKEMLKQGLNKLNEISGINMAFDKETDSTSNRTILAFDSNLLGFYSSQRNK
jgi:hypothetical protein